MPLMAVSLLASCGGSKEPTKVSYTLTYTYDNGTDDKYVETYAEGEKTQRPTWEPVYSNFTFDGWFTESGTGGSEFNFGSVLTTNTVVYAHWSDGPTPVVSHKLVYNFDNGTSDTYTETYVGSKETTKPTWKPDYAGHTFAGWYENEQGEGTDKPFIFGSSLTLEETHIYAHWTNIPVNYTISYSGVNCKAYRAGVSPTSAAYSTQFTWRTEISDDYNIVLVPDTDCNLPDSISVLFNGQPGIPETDYSYKKDSKTIAIYKKADALISLTAVPTATYTVYWVNYDGTILETDDVTSGTLPECSVTPTKEGDFYYDYVFNGWAPEVTEVTDSDQIYVAQYDKVSAVDTRLYVTIPEGGATVGFNYEATDTLTIDWGDDNQSNDNDPIYTSHGYTVPGEYIVNISGNIRNMVIPSEGDEKDCITSAYLGSTITSIPEDAFACCDSLSSIVIGSSVASIGEMAFYALHELSSVVFRNNFALKTIDSYAFGYCDALESIMLPEGLEEIGYSAFANCENLKNITLPDSLKTLGEASFYNCKNLKSITLPDDLETISKDAFNNAALESINIGEKVSYIGDDAFYCCPLKSIEVHENNSTYNDGNCGAIIETATNTLLVGTSNNIPSSIYKIGLNAFSNRPNLTNVVISEGVSVVESYAFCYAPNLVSISIPSTVSDLGNNIVEACPLLTTITVNDNNTTYSDGDCNAIIENESNTLICGCGTTVIPNGVEIIGYAAFRDCSSLKSITLPNTITEIGSRAFSYCGNITSISFPKSIQKIGSNAFQYCTNLTDVTFENGGQSQLVIDELAFAGCEEIKQIIFPNNLKKIGLCTFRFCYSLMLVDLRNINSVVEAGSLLFEDDTQNFAIRVPSNLVNDYKSASGWSTYASHIVGA